MIRLLADENFNNNIVRGVRLRMPDIDLVRVQDVGLSGANDLTVVDHSEWTQDCRITSWTPVRVRPLPVIGTSAALPVAILLRPERQQCLGGLRC